MAHEAVELDERARVEQLLQPLVREQLPLAPVLLDGLLAGRMQGLLAQLLEPLQLALGRFGAIVGRRHACEPN